MRPVWVAVILGFFTYHAHALRCYQCSSENDPECMENFDTGNEERFLTATDCDVNGARYCVKTTGIYGSVVGTRRFCSSRDFHNICQYVSYPDHDRTYRACVYTCSSDECNSSTNTLPSIITIIATVLGALLYMVPY